MNLTRFSNSEFQNQLTKTHILALCASTHIIGSNPLLEFNNFKDIVDNFSRNVDFLNNRFGRIFVIFSITNSLEKDLDIYSQIDWKIVLSSLLSMKVTFKVVVCICDQKSFNFRKRASQITSLWSMDFIRLPSRRFFYRGH